MWDLLMTICTAQLYAIIFEIRGEVKVHVIVMQLTWWPTYKHPKICSSDLAGQSRDFPVSFLAKGLFSFILKNTVHFPSMQAKLMVQQVDQSDKIDKIMG